FLHICSPINIFLVSLTTSFSRLSGRGENRIDQRGDLDDVRVKVHGEFGEVDVGEFGAAFGKFGPGRIGWKVDSAPFFIAVANVAHAAKQVSQVSDTDEKIAGRT